MIKKTSFLCLILLLFGCGQANNSETQDTTGYFGIASLLDEQVGALLRMNAGLEKSVTSGGTAETLELSPKDSAEWRSQLQLFFDADISRPGYTGAYFVEELPAISSLSKTIYTARKKQNFVRVMECTYERDLLKEVRLELSKNNEVFKLDQELFLYFNLESGESRLSSFSISGDEKMRLKEGLSFDVKGTIVIP